jgi:Holliday junction resolvase RusA-like endonuclease
MQAIRLTIYGEPASKANSRRVVRIGNRVASIKSEKALNYASMFKRQIPDGIVPIEGDVSVSMTIYYASRRPDLDESLILDLLQDAAYLNDRQVKEKHIFWGLDKENPRTIIEVTKKEGSEEPSKHLRKEKTKSHSKGVNAG